MTPLPGPNSTTHFLEDKFALSVISFEYFLEEAAIVPVALRLFSEILKKFMINVL